MDIRRLVRSNIRSLSAYNAKEIPCDIKLDANESPYGFRVMSSWMNRYPDPEARELRSVFAKKIGVSPGNLLHGNGSDELIYYLITVFGGPVLYPVPTFSMYGIISQALSVERIEVPLDSTFDLDMERMMREIKTLEPRLIFLSSPNNPTGNCFSHEKILKIIRSSGAIVVVDEAYQPFSSQDSFIPYIRKYNNLVVLRTLSKIGLAGLRVGFIIADRRIIEEVNKVRLPFNLNTLSQKIAIQALRDGKNIERAVRTIITERDKLYSKLIEMEGITPYPSQANFILFKADHPEKIYRGLLKQGILIRDMSSTLKGCLRVTVGKPSENRRFIKTLKGLL